MTWKMFLFYQPRWKEKMRDLQGHWILKKQVLLLIRVSSEDDSFCKTFFQQKLTPIINSVKVTSLDRLDYRHFSNDCKTLKNSLLPKFSSLTILNWFVSLPVKLAWLNQAKKENYDLKKYYNPPAFEQKILWIFNRPGWQQCCSVFFLWTLFDAITGVFFNNKKDKS